MRTLPGVNYLFRWGGWAGGVLPPGGGVGSGQEFPTRGRDPPGPKTNLGFPGGSPARQPHLPLGRPTAPAAGRRGPGRLLRPPLLAVVRASRGGALPRGQLEQQHTALAEFLFERQEKKMTYHKIAHV